MKIVFEILCLILLTCFSNSMSYSQEKLVPLSGNPLIRKYLLDHPEKRFKNIENQDTLQLPFKDDFSSYRLFPADSIWEDNFAFVNTDYGDNPVSLGVVTLDAINFDGTIYPGAGSSPFIADYLTSRPIDLSPYQKSDSIYFSFLFQPQGYGDEPENSDSLILEFFSTETQTWYPKWRTAGLPNQSFKLVMIPVDTSLFFMKGFKFRFYNYASLTGIYEASWASNVDHWNLDYIYLDKDRGKHDTIFSDLAFIYPMKSLLRHYESMPWTHYQQDHSEMNDHLTITCRNNDSIPKNLYRDFFIYDMLQEDTLCTFTGGAINFPALYDTIIPHNFSCVYNSDSPGWALFEFKSILATGAFIELFRCNDTLTYYQLFKNYYAYDDGTAENGYGLSGEGSQNGKLAYQFNNFKTNDTLQGIDMYFNQTLNDVSQKYFYLTVWNHNSLYNCPDSVLYSQIGVKPEYGDSLNDFHTYVLDTPLVVPEIFYVGWTQTTTDLLNVGFDRNRLKNDSNQSGWVNPRIYYDISGAWVHSSFEGALMIRPIFGKRLDPDVVHEQPVNAGYSLFPNPASEIINIAYPVSNHDDKYIIFITDMVGKSIMQFDFPVQQFSLSSINNGIYFIRIFKNKQVQFSGKFVVLK